jgi:predicted kinase
MEAVILTGLQGSGKSTFCKERLFDTHIRVNLDMLRTRHREKLLLDACIAAKQSFVVDGTTPTRAERAPYIEAARGGGFRVVGYYFASQVEICKARNASRAEAKVVPLKGLLGTYRRMQLPTRDEGYDELHYVSITDDCRFAVEEWIDEVR